MNTATVQPDTGAVRRLIAVLALVILTALAQSIAHAGEFDDALLDIQHRWAQANYQESGRAQKDAFESLLEDARAFAASNPERPEPLIWQGIVASTYAGVKGPFGAMALAREARDALHAAEQIDPSALDGAVYTSLGALYYKVPGGIIGFGDDDVALEYLRQALQVNPDGIDSNFFYGEYMFEHDELEQARAALLRAQNAPRRSDRPLADAGRQREISALLAEVDQRIEHNG